MGIAGLVYLAVPFVRSLSPSAEAVANLPHVDISMVAPGTIVLLKHPKPFALWNGYTNSVLVYRRIDASVVAWEVPAKDGAVGLPDLRWWRPIYACENFGPVYRDGLVDESKPLECHDLKMPSEWWAEQWRWNTEGKNLLGMVDDMPRAEGTIHGKYFVIGEDS